MTSLLDELIGRLTDLPADDMQQIAKDVASATAGQAWFPQPGPQTEAYFSEADELFYGGQAGGGKTDLILGLATTAHHESLILRRQSKEALQLFERLQGILGTTEGRNMGARSCWAMPGGGKIDIGGCQYESDKEKYKGIPHDLIAFDEIPDFSRSQYEFIKTWNRSVRPGQRCRVVCCGNPPTRPTGLWVIDYWAPWLDPKHPSPAKDGELRWFVVDDRGVNHEVQGSGFWDLSTGKPIAVPEHLHQKHHLRSTSRTFIRARLSDNKYLSDSDYARTLDSLPPEIRKAYRDGLFDASIKDDPWQVIPSEWVRAAQDRWREAIAPPSLRMTAIGVDVAQGGEDDTVLAPRRDWWFEELVRVPGKDTPLGSDVAALVLGKRRDNALPVVDMGGGYGGGVIQVFEENQIKYFAYKGSSEATGRTKDGKLGFEKVRGQAYWQFREALDPDQPGGSLICLPPSTRLYADLTTPTFEVRGTQIVVMSKKNVVKALNRSPDEGDAVVMSWFAGDKNIHTYSTINRTSQKAHTVNLGYMSRRRR